MSYRFISCLIGAFLLAGCVDPDDPALFGTVNTLVVDGLITNLIEPQLVRLNQSKADPLTGRFGTIPVRQATVEVIVDSAQVIPFHETEAGRYQAPSDFVGQVGHRYQLRFTLQDGHAYASTTEVMRPVPAIDKVAAQYNPKSLSPAEQLKGGYAAAHDFYIDWQDPASQTNYYRWDWIDWERQEWCRTCHGGLYQIMDSQGNLIEDCVNSQYGNFSYDYNCRTPCWEIIHGIGLNLFSDQYTNGNKQQGWRVAQIPIYSKEHCLVEIRQSSLTPTAYTYLKRLSDQTQKAGGVADTPASIPVGNVGNRKMPNELVVGYFSASAVSSVRYWLTRSDAPGFAPGLYQAFNDGNDPVNEPSNFGRYRPPLAVCVLSDSRTPVRPDGWRDK